MSQQWGTNMMKLLENIGTFAKWSQGMPMFNNFDVYKVGWKCA